MEIAEFYCHNFFAKIPSNQRFTINWIVKEKTKKIEILDDEIANWCEMMQNDVNWGKMVWTDEKWYEKWYMMTWMTQMNRTSKYFGFQNDWKS